MQFSHGPEASRGGSALVECLVALAVAAAVFLPALAVLRAAVRDDARVAARAGKDAASRPAARREAARLRLAATPGETNAEALPPLSFRVSGSPIPPP